MQARQVKMPYMPERIRELPFMIEMISTTTGMSRYRRGSSGLATAILASSLPPARLARFLAR